MSYKFVEVQWLDAVSWSAWHELEGKFKPAPIITRGWLIQDKKTYVVLATSMDASQKAGPGGLWTIPRGMITDIYEINIK